MIKFKKRGIIILAVLLLTCITLLGSGYYALVQFAQQPLTVTASSQLFTLKKGTSVLQLAQQLEQAQLLNNSTLLPYLLRLNPELNKIKAGTYRLTDQMSVMAFLTLLNSGKEAQFSIQFIEGTRLKEWLVILANTPYLEHQLAGLTPDEISQQLGITESLEGWLTPDTYHYTANTSDLEILKRAYQRMLVTVQSVWEARDQRVPYKSPYELLIMASIIEKETAVDAERSKVASVFVNRLNLRMKLQTDPTIIYGMGDNYSGMIRRADINDASNRYNTYVIDGLPPTPIAMPSIASLEAAAHPDESQYLYFVADGYGGHIFSTNLASHNLAVKEYWRLMRSRNNP